MTSKVSRQFLLIVLTVTAIVGASVGVAHAQDYSSSWDTGSGGYSTSWDTGSGYSTSYDTGSYYPSYSTSYDTSSYPGYSTSWDTGSGYSTSYDTGSYPYYSTSWDTGGNSTYGAGSAYTGGCSDCTYGSGSQYTGGNSTYGSGSAYPGSTYGSGSVYTGGCSTCVTPTTVTATDVYGTPTTQVGGVGYSYQNYGTGLGLGMGLGYGLGYGGIGYGGIGYGGGMAFGAPASYYSGGVMPPTPTPVPQQPVVQPSTVTNTCISNSCNNTTTNTYTYTDNSNSHNTTISGSYNTVTPIVAASSLPPSYPVQYTYPSYYPSYAPAPTCSITLSYNPGGAATLTWYSTGATSAYITPGIGSVPLAGTRVVPGGYGAIYTMGVAGPGGSNSCRTAVYTAPMPSTYVSLSQIPYTGFDLGPVGDALYWLALLAFAAAGAYLLVYYRGGAGVLAAVMLARRSGDAVKTAAKKPAQAIDAVVAPVAKKIEEVKESFASLSDLPVFERKGTSDSMHVVHSEHGEAPRIIITRE